MDQHAEQGTGSTVGPGDEATPPGPGDSSGSDADVTNPAKLIRLGTMINQLLNEVRAASPDDEGLARLAVIHSQTLTELSEVLSPELFDELMEFNACCSGDTTPTESEIRVAQAQLVGWLQGLLQGMQASAATQALQAQRQLAEMRQDTRGPAPGQPHPLAGGPTGYL